jgi:hypothetical protein
MLSKTLYRTLLIIMSAFAVYITAYTSEYAQKIKPNTTLPTQYSGFTITGKRPGGRTIQVLVALAAENQYLILSDRTRPLIDPNCPSGCRVFWGIKGIPNISYSLPAELARPEQYRFQAVADNANFEVTLFLTTDAGPQEIDAQSWRTLPMQKVDDIVFFEAIFTTKKKGDKLPAVSLGFTVTEQGIPIEFQP